MLGSYCKKENESTAALIKRILNDEEEKSEFQSKFEEFLNKEFRSIWKDHDINIRLSFDGANLKIQIADSDTVHKVFKMGKRSDGFKRFMAIMTSFSFLSRVELLSGKVIVIDEPEIHLHPSGIRCLRDELLNIARNNILLLATHSPFMIDTDALERHYIVEKKTGDTTISHINSSTIADDEVLSRAFGIDVFSEMLPEKSIIVEGKEDKIIINKLLSDFNGLSYNIFSADGASKARVLSNILEKNKLTFIFDADNEGIKEKKNLKTAKKDAYILSDIVKDIPQSATIEDLYPLGYVNDFVKKNVDKNIDIKADVAMLVQLCQQSTIAKDDKEYRNKIKKQMAEQLIGKNWPSNLKVEGERLYTLQSWLKNHLQPK